MRLLEGRAPQYEISAPIQNDTTELASFSLLLPREYGEKGATYKPGREFTPGTQPSSHLTLASQAPEL